MYTKRIIFLIFSFLVILLSAKPCMAESSFQCLLSEDGVLTITGSGKIENKSFLDRLDSYDEVKKIVIEEGITEIPTLFFYEFDFVEEVKLPDSLKCIGRSAFYCCRHLKKVTFGKNLEKVGKGAFEKCSQLKTLHLPDSVKIIEPHAFVGCLRLEKLVIPISLKSWQKNITEQCPSLKTVVNRSKKTIRIDNCGGNRIWRVNGKTTTTIPKGKIAKARGKRIPITYQLLGGKQTGKLPKSYEYGTIIRIPMNVKKKGYTMVAWNFRDQTDEDDGYFFLSIGPDATKVVLRPLWFKYSVTNPKKGTVHVHIDGSKTYQQFDYYEIRYSEKKDMSNAIQSNIIGVDIFDVFTGLKKGKTYYFQFRAYTQPDEAEDGEPGKWCGMKKITIKK